ncbi:MAG TPA: ParB/RepB/Spo0J family partition protein [Actinomycetota bacterium]|nr:ParB/RepB/Spo0J family partition protein [Actinomycetota bacterium]
MTQQRGGLGRGLSALIPGAAEEAGLVEIPVGAIAPNPRQPRETFDEEGIDALARSIREVGVLQPIVVRRRDRGYELVAGERRLRAARRAGLATIPAILRESDDAESLREALIENIHRQDLSPLEQAAAFQELLEDLGVSQETLAERLGYSRPHVTNTIRLLQLPGEVQRLLAEGSLSAGHARALLSLPDAGGQTALALRVAAEGLSVRQTEELVKTYAAGTGTPRRRGEPAARDARLVQAEEALADHLGTRVSVQLGRRKGKVVIEVGSREDLDRIVDAIVGGP